jgi:hypothetical protein
MKHPFRPDEAPWYINRSPIEVETTADLIICGALIAEPTVTLTIADVRTNPIVVNYEFEDHAGTVVEVDAQKWHVTHKSEQAAWPEIAVFVSACDCAFTDAVRAEAAEQLQTAMAA